MVGPPKLGKTLAAVDLDCALAEKRSMINLPTALLRDACADLLELRGEDLHKTAYDNDREAERYMAL